MSEKQRAKHIMESVKAKDIYPNGFSVGSSLDVAPSSPDGLGAWEGGKVHCSIDGAKAKPQRTGSAKNTPGIDYASKITQRHQKDFNEIHTDANGDFWLYNHKTDAWDILGDSADIPYYDNGTELLAYNVSTGKWDVPVVVEEQDEPTPTA